MVLTSERLLRSMTPGREYPPSELAGRFSTSTAQVKDMLCTLAEDGLVRMHSHTSRIIRFERLSAAATAAAVAATDGASEPAEPPSVATMPVTRQLTGALTGYGASLASLRSLAMLTR